MTSPFTPSEMERDIGEPFNARIWERIGAGLNIYDAPAHALTKGYMRFKQRQGKNGIRDLTLTHQTRNQVKVLRVSANDGVIGPIPGAVRRPYRDAQIYRALPIADILRINNRREAQWGVSPSDRQFLAELVARKLDERTKKVTRIA